MRLTPPQLTESDGDVDGHRQGARASRFDGAAGGDHNSYFSSASFKSTSYLRNERSGFELLNIEAATWIDNWFTFWIWSRRCRQSKKNKTLTEKRTKKERKETQNFFRLLSKLRFDGWQLFSLHKKVSLKMYIKMIITGWYSIDWPHRLVYEWPPTTFFSIYLSTCSFWLSAATKETSLFQNPCKKKRQLGKMHLEEKKHLIWWWWWLVACLELLSLIFSPFFLPLLSIHPVCSLLHTTFGKKDVASVSHPIVYA